MGRTAFPTRNDIGVRDFSTSVTLGNYFYNEHRGPAEPAAKAAMNPVNLGAALSDVQSYPIRYAPIVVRSTATPPQLPRLAPPPVSAQSSPTPQVTVPAAPPPTAVLVSSGGGTSSPAPAADSSGVTQSPTTSTIVTAAPGVADQVAAWLGGTTPIFSYNVPNALLAGGVVLVFALLMGGGKKR